MGRQHQTEPQCVSVVKMHNPGDTALNLNFCYIEQRRNVLEKLVCKMCNTELPCLLCVQLLQHSEVPES